MIQEIYKEINPMAGYTRFIKVTYSDFGISIIKEETNPAGYFSSSTITAAIDRDAKAFKLIIGNFYLDSVRGDGRCSRHGVMRHYFDFYISQLNHFNFFDGKMEFDSVQKVLYYRRYNKVVKKGYYECFDFLCEAYIILMREKGVALFRTAAGS